MQIPIHFSSCTFVALVKFLFSSLLLLFWYFLTIDFPSTGEVRLYYNYNYASHYHGRVEVYLGEVWGTVSDDGSWSVADGEVVCRELGFEIPSKFSIQNSP